MYRLAMSVPFNWTKVELKHSKINFITNKFNAFNWTKVELKQPKDNRKRRCIFAFNWTKVELKQSAYKVNKIQLYLLIELR